MADKLLRAWNAPRRLHFGALLAAMAAALAIGVPVALATVHDYEYGGPWPTCVNWDYQQNSAYNYMQSNRVYRPTPKTFALFYSGGAQYEENRNSNPFWHQQSGGYVQAFGADVDPYDHSGTCTVTFQYTT